MSSTAVAPRESLDVQLSTAAQSLRYPKEFSSDDPAQILKQLRVSRTGGVRGVLGVNFDSGSNDIDPAGSVSEAITRFGRYADYLVVNLCEL